MRATESTPQGVVAGTISFTLGHPDRSLLPLSDIAAAADAVLQGPEALAMLQYGPERGTPSLIEFLVERLNRTENLAVGTENLMLISGSTHGVDMVCRLFVGAGETVLVEAPSYRDALHILRDHKTSLTAVPIDEHGVIVAAMDEILARLQREGKSPKLFYTIPNFQNPTGLTTTRERRANVLALANAHGFRILEDDVYREIAFEDETPPSYFELAGGKNVLRIGSFSKTLAPGLRLGWLAGEPADIDRCLNCGTTQMGGGANPFVAHIIATYCRSGKWDAHIARLQNAYRRRRDAALAALEAHMPKGVTWTIPLGGYFLWLMLPPAVEATVLQEEVRARGVFFSAGPGFFVNPTDGKQYLRLAYSFVSLDELELGIEILAKAIIRLARE
ncbi:MAG: aminotransferase class I/II-fold pyridoxal phosphate-dependent enzyme [Anaerolineales bacterium]|nr:aminotransferase class I/II-fold pyridoxal phosphate-dependent enzyme [Anaerolineales bacterium]